MQIEKVPKVWAVCLGFVIILVLFRIALPYVGKYYINQALENSLDVYDGRIDDLSITVFAGGYYIDNLTVWKNSSQKRKFLTIKNMYAQLDRRLLLQGRVVLRIYVTDAEMNIIYSKDDAKKQMGVVNEKAQHWTQALEAVVPLTIAAVKLTDVTFNFLHTDIEDLANISLKVSDGDIDYLLDPKNSQTGYSPINLNATLNDHAPILLSGGIDIAQKKPRFDVNFHIWEFHLKTINKLLKNYLPIDVSSGEIEIVSEMKGNTLNSQGYAKVFVKDLDVVELDQKYTSVQHALTEWLGGFYVWILDVFSFGNFATEIPIKIQSGKLNINKDKAFWKALENNFDRLDKEFKNL